MDNCSSCLDICCRWWFSSSW